MTVEQRPPRQAVSFTPAEARVLPLLATHLTLSAIADHLGVRRSTVKTHVASIYRKLGANSRAEAVACAERIGALRPGAPTGP
jgi:LuxR family maltose regulon positive regulatory protein